MTELVGCAEKVEDISAEEFLRRLSESGVGIRIGPFAARIKASAEALEEPLYQLYGNYPLLPDNSVHSFHVCLTDVRKLPLLKRLCRFSVDGRVPHQDMPAYQALAVLEWGINLVIALRSHAFLMLHSAVLEKNGSAILLPAEPGHGKSTLCAAMAYRSWRLFSDEFGLVRPLCGELVSIPRPIALKNQSIDVIRNFVPEAYVGPLIHNTRKGTVAHVKAPKPSVQNQTTGAYAKWIVFPRWVEGAPLSLEPVPKAEAFMLVATNAFNYELLGEAAFMAVATLTDSSDCYRLVYSDLDEAIACLDALADADETG